MELKVSNFGDVLMSRPAGREDFLKAKAYVFKDIKTGEIVVLDFDKVKILAPSWADEFISGIQNDYGSEVQRAYIIRKIALCIFLFAALSAGSDVYAEDTI